jgi:hypothetical protein
MIKEKFFRIFLKGDTSGKTIETCDTQLEVDKFLDDNITMDLEVEEWEMNPDGSDIKKVE